MEGTPADKEDVNLIQEHMKSFEKAGPSAGHTFIAQCRVRVLKDTEHMILYYALSSLIEPTLGHRLDAALHRCFLVMGSEIKQGSAPPSLAEKKLQEHINDLKKELGHKMGGRGE